MTSAPVTPSHDAGHATSAINSAFSAEDRKELAHEDLNAAENTLAVLLSIVTFGVLLGIVGVLLCLRFT